MSEPSAARELFRRSFGESFGEDAGVFRAADFDPGLDDCSSDEEEAARKRVPAEDTETPKKKQHWVDPERQVDKELLLLCQGRVRRRAELIDTIRRAYLQDVVLLKSIVMQQFNEVQTETVARQWRDAIPSLDVRQLFWLHAPDETTLAVLPCKTCGGSVELMHHDSPEIERLTKLVAMQEHQSHDLKILVATQKAKLETAEFQLQDATNSHLKEKQVMFGKMRDLRAHADGVEARHEKCAEDLKATAGRLERLQASTADYREVVDARKRLEIEAINLNTALSQRSDALVKESALLSSANEEIMVLKKQAIASQSALSKASAQIEELNISVNKATKVYEQAEARYEKTQGFLDDLRREFTQLEAAKNSLAIDLSMLEETSSREIEQFEARQASLKAQNKRLTSDLAISRDMADLLRAKLEMENPDALNNAHEEQVFRLQDELATANAEIQRLKAELENVPVSGLSLANSFVSQSSAGAVKANEPPHAKSNSQSHTRPQAASTSYSVQKKAPPRAIITQQSSDELRREEAAWQAGSQSMDSEAPPPPELPPASLNDTPHPERLIKPFFQTFASEDNDLMAEQSDEDMSSGDSDIFTDEDHSAAEIIKQPIDKSRGKPKGGAPPPTPKKSGGGFGKDFPEEGTAISPGSLPATAAINRRKSLSFAEQARSDSITEADETEAAAVLLATRKYKLVKRKVKKLVKIKRVVKVWIKRRSIALVDALVPSAELSVDMGTDVLPAAHNLSVAGSRESVAPSSSERTPPPFDDSDTEVVTNQPSSRPVSAVEAIEEVNASTPGSPAKLADGSTVSSIPISSCDDAAIARMPPSHQAESASVSGPPVAQDTEVVNKKEEIDAARAEDVAGARDSFTEKEKTFEATTADLIEPPCVKRHVMEVILRSAPPIEDMELYEEVEREIEEEEEQEVEETVQEIIQDVEDEIPMTSKKKRKLKVGTSNGNGTVNMPARREYVAVAKNSLDGSGSSKVKIAVPKANNRPAARVMAQAPAAYAFDKIKETGMSTEMLDPDGDDDVEFDGTGFGNEDDSSETAKLWGSVMTDLRKVLRQTNELKGQHELIKAVVASVGPRLRGLCEQFSKTQIALWRTMKATKTTCDFVSLMRPTVTGLLSTLSISSSLKKGDIDVIFASVLQSRDRETKGVKADPESTIYASREILRPWAQGIDIDHETVGALTESSDLAVLGSAALNADGTQQPSLPSITAAEFFGDDPATRSRRTETVIASAESMIVYEKMAMKDINHLLLRYIEQAKFKQVEMVSKIVALEATIAENTQLENSNRERIAKNKIVEIKDDTLQGLLKDKRKLDDILKALAAEKENVVALKEQVLKLEMNVMSADRKLEEIPVLQGKLAMVNEIQTETQKQLSQQSLELDQALREFHAKSAQLESVKGERIALQHEVSDLKNRIDHLDVDLAGMRELQKRTAAALEGMNELDRARKGKQSTVACQHEPDKSFSVDLGIQTEFLYPPLTLRQRIGTAIPGTASNRSGPTKQQQPLFPAVTVSCSLDSMNALSTYHVPRCGTSVSSRRGTSMSRRGDTSAGNSFFTMSQFSNSIGDFRSKIDCPDPDGDQNSLFGGPSVRDSKPVHPKSADGPTYTFRTPADNRAVRTTGNQPRQRAIGLNLPLVVASDGLEDLSTATPGLLDSDRSLRSHSSIINEQKDFRLSSRFDSSNMTDEIGPDGSPGCYSPDIDMSRSNSRVSTAQTRPGGYQAFQPPLSPMKSVVPMSYTEQLEYNQRAQADSIKPQVNNLSPLMLSGQPRSQEDLIRQSPSHSNGGRAQTAASVNPVSGISLLSGAFSHISSSESIYSQGSESSGASRGSKSRGGNKIITGLPGQDPMSVSAYRRFVGTAAASNN